MPAIIPVITHNPQVSSQRKQAISDGTLFPLLSVKRFSPEACRRFPLSVEFWCRAWALKLYCPGLYSDSLAFLLFWRLRQGSSRPGWKTVRPWLCKYFHLLVLNFLSYNLGIRTCLGELLSELALICTSIGNMPDTYIKCLVSEHHHCDAHSSNCVTHAPLN